LGCRPPSLFCPSRVRPCVRCRCCLRSSVALSALPDHSSDRGSMPYLQSTQFTGDEMRSFFTVAAVLGLLGAGLAPARAQFHGPGTDSEMGDQQTCQLVAQGETCAKFKELKVGMTASQVLSACGQRPPRTSAMITTGGRKLAIWSYGNSQLHLIDDKLVQIFGP
jgi:hypothetical protein